MTRKIAWNAAELVAATFPEPRWAVPGIVPEGLTLLCGAPKLGKSWLALNLGVAVSSGGLALGSIQVDQGDVLYLALEDTPRRLQGRLLSMLRGAQAPNRLLLATEWPTMDDGAVEQLSAALATRPETRLVVVDVLARIRGRGERGETFYERDYRTVAALKAVADTASLAMVVITHVRKASVEDFLDAVSGTNGLAGAADTIAILRRARGKADAELKITGRDVEEAEHALTFEATIGTWRLLRGDVRDYRLHDTRRLILESIREHGPMTPKQLAEGTGIEYETAKKTVQRMANDGQIHADTGGRYREAQVSLSLVSPESLGDSRDTRDRDSGEDDS